jgi:small-conductance mechanosensitive channel
MDTSGRVFDALVLAAIWIAAIVVLRAVLWWLYGRYERRLAEKDSTGAARRRTTFAILLRVVVALAVLIGTWSVLKVFPATTEIANAFLASSAVLAVIAGVALSNPLGNLGSGVLLAFTQPVRLGDRITVGDHTGNVKEITLTYTTLVTEDGDHVFVPNQTMVSTTLVNRSVGSHAP